MLMMKLSLMHKVVAGLDKEHRSALLSAVASPWGCDPTRVYFWRASANFACVSTIGDQRVFLRFNSMSEREPELVAAEVEVLDALATMGLCVNVPVRTLSGRYVEVVETEWGTFVAAAFTRLTGKHIDACDMSPQQLVAWGAQLANLHNAMEKLPLGLAARRRSFTDILDFAALFAPQPEVQAEIQAVREQLNMLEQTLQNYGLIHFDFEADNLMWEEGKVAVLDFDDSARLWYGADLVFATRDLFKGTAIDVLDQRFQRFLLGYRSHRFLDDVELVRMPLYIRLHRLASIARLGRCLDIDQNNLEYPDWLLNLYRKLSVLLDQYTADIRSGEIICR